MIKLEHDSSSVAHGKIVWCTVVVLLAVVAAALAARAVTFRGRGRLGLGSARDWDATRDEPSQVEARLFATRTAAESAALRAKQRLASYGWVDRERGIVHVPIRVAMQLYLDEQERKQP